MNTIALLGDPGEVWYITPACDLIGFKISHYSTGESNIWARALLPWHAACTSTAWDAAVLMRFLPCLR